MYQSKTPEVNWSKLVDEVLASEFAEEERKDSKVGLQETHFSEHSRNIAILEGFDYDISWAKAHSDLNEFLEGEFDDWWEDEKSSYAFEQWWYGGKVELAASGYDIANRLVEHYRLRIEDVHKCEECGREISEKYSDEHPRSVHRLGHRPSGTEVWTYSIYCKTCLRKKWGSGKQ